MMRTARALLYGGRGVSLTETPWTETPLTETPWTETRRTKTPLDGDPLVM